MKHLKKSPVILLLTLLTVIIGSWTFAPGFSGWNLFDKVQDADRAKAVRQDSVPISAGDELGLKSITSIIFQSNDAGQTWQDISQDLPEREQPEDFFAGESDLYLYVKNVLYRSKSNLKTPVWEKEGKNWKQVQKGLVMNVVESEGVLIASGGSGILRSTDHGKHWERVISEGGVGIAVERIDGGFAAISYSNFTKSRRIRISMDSGKTWTAIDEGLQPSLNVSSIKQVGKYLLCGHPDGIFRSSDMGRTWKLVHPSVDNVFKVSDTLWNPVPSRDNRRVFKLYVSGNVLYAVARNSGC